jgi:hypothetical protein
MSKHSLDMRAFTRVALVVIFSVAAFEGSTQRAFSQRIAPPTREGRWQEDLSVLVKEISSNQKDFNRLYPKDQFEGEVAAINQAIPRLSDSEIILRLMRLVASAHVGHTRLRFPPVPIAFHRLPLNLSWYSGDLAVVAAAREYQEALGARVLKIGSMTPTQLEAAVAPYISYENDFGLHQESPTYMLVDELLRQLKIAKPDGRVEFTLAKSDGREFSLTIAPVDWGAATPNTMVSAADVLPIPPALYRRHPYSYYWYEYLPDSQSLYIQYSLCQNDPKLPFKDFAKQLFDFADAHTIHRVIVDLRFNQGGDSRIINPLESGLKSRTALIARGHLYTLIGRATFSSGLIAALDFRDSLHAILIGEPTGEKPNHYGEVKQLTLPNSKLEVRYSTTFFQLIRDSNPPWLAPDIVVTRSLKDFLDGRDPALDAALRHSVQ